MNTAVPLVVEAIGHAAIEAGQGAYLPYRDAAELVRSLGVVQSRDRALELQMEGVALVDRVFQFDDHHICGTVDHCLESAARTRAHVERAAPGAIVASGIFLGR